MCLKRGGYIPMQVSFQKLQSQWLGKAISTIHNPLFPLHPAAFQSLRESLKPRTEHHAADGSAQHGVSQAIIPVALLTISGTAAHACIHIIAAMSPYWLTASSQLATCPRSFSHKPQLNQVSVDLLLHILYFDFFCLTLVKACQNSSN